MGLGNLINLYRIQKLYGLFRKGKENPALFKDIKYWQEVFETALSIKEIQEMLKGYKTYIVAALLAIVTAAHALGYIDDALYQALLALLASSGLATVAAKIGRIQNDIKINEAKREKTAFIERLR